MKIGGLSKKTYQHLRVVPVLCRNKLPKIPSRFVILTNVSAIVTEKTVPQNTKSKSELTEIFISF